MIAFEIRLLDLFKTVFPYRNKLNRHIMDTEKVHSVKHCHVDVTNYANPINCCCDGPEGGHKTWVHEQGLRTNQGSSSAKTLMTHSLNKLPDKFARFLFEYHSHRFESLDLPPLPADRSDFDVHGALLDDKVQINCNALHFAMS